MSAPLPDAAPEPDKELIRQARAKARDDHAKARDHHAKARDYHAVSPSDGQTLAASLDQSVRPPLSVCGAT